MLSESASQIQVIGLLAAGSTVTAVQEIFHKLLQTKKGKVIVQLMKFRKGKDQSFVASLLHKTTVSDTN